jgi:hypothetical protein
MMFSQVAPTLSMEIGVGVNLHRAVAVGMAMGL